MPSSDIEPLTPENINSRFSGREPLPVDVAVEGTYYLPDRRSISFTQTLTRFENASDIVKRVADMVKSESISLQGLFREVAAFLVIYKDGSAEANCMTSDLAEHVDGNLHFEVLEKKRILDELDKGCIPAHVFHFHSHPGPEYWSAAKQDSTMLINAVDYDAYQKFSAFLSAYAGTNIPVTGIVRTIGSTCGDVIIRTTAEPNDPDRGMFIRAGATKIQRGLSNLTP